MRLRARRVKFILGVLTLRRYEQLHMPTYGTSLGFELFLRLAQLAQVRDGPQQGVLKQLYLELPYSHQAVRLHLRKLEADGWISLARTSSDGRVRSVLLSERYELVFDQYMQEFASLMDPELPASQEPVGNPGITDV